MSRGPGRMMRYALAYLAERARKRSFDPENWHSLHVMAWCYRKDQMKKANDDRQVIVDYVEQESLRRAIRTLAAAGRVETCQIWRHDLPEWSGLHFRLSADALKSLSVGESPTLSPEETGNLVAHIADALSGAAP